jgi:NIPSNAP
MAPITLCIRYTIDANKLPDFEEYARHWPEVIRRSGGELVGYYAPTKLAGPTNFALALIDFRDLAAYERYREALMKDAEAVANVAAAEATKCILVEDRSFLRRVS